jgi:multisubunit Na+/H+ antiporter MnhC subunit
MLTVNALIISTIILDVGIQSLIIDRIFRAKQGTKRREEVEEENLTRYESNTSSDQTKGWEFKILRTNSGGFRSRKVLNKVCAEESQASWILLEKLDDHRLRFRRPVTARDRDHQCKIDPYRTRYGISEIVETWTTIIVLLIIMSSAAVLGFVAINKFFGDWQTRGVQNAPRSGDNNAIRQPPTLNPKPNQ